jgi:hypothetical protein
MEFEMTDNTDKTDPMKNTIKTNPNQEGITKAKYNILCTAVSLAVGCVTLLGISALFAAGVFGSILLAPKGIQFGISFMAPAMEFWPICGFAAATVIGIVLIPVFLLIPLGAFAGAPILGLACGLVVIWLFISFAIGAGLQIRNAINNLRLQKLAGEDGVEWNVDENTFNLLRKNSFPCEFTDSIKNVANSVIGNPFSAMESETEKEIIEIMIPPPANSTPGTAAATGSNLKKLIAKAVYRTMEYHDLDVKDREKIARHIAKIFANLSKENANDTIKDIANALKVEEKRRSYGRGSTGKTLVEQILKCEVREKSTKDHFNVSSDLSINNS